jgi:DNA repair protein RadA/Sms
LALLSSFKNIALSPKLVAFGEVGLSGEVRSVSMAAQRVAEAKKLGFDTCVLPAVCMKGLKSDEKMRLIGVKNIQDVIDVLIR